jgi:hypothetical protein
MSQSPDKSYSFKISVFSGDIIYSLPGIKKCVEQYGVPASIYLWLDRPWQDYTELGQKHPYGVNQYALDMMKPLLESQPYIKLCKKWEGEDIAVDLDDQRTKTISTMPRGCITQWPGQIWPDLICDTSKPWLNLTELNGYFKNPDVVGKILVNRTSRWRNDMIHYFYLREYADQLLFVGLEEEHAALCKEWDLDIPYYKTSNFLDLAIAIRSCRLFIGNQSLCFALAEAMKIPRILEICPHAPNVIPSGPDGYYFLHQGAFEILMKNLTKKL